MDNISWDLMRSFLLVAREGSLSAAARSLGVAQSTLSRNIQALENQTKLQLFQRTTQGLSLTASGQKLIDATEKMDEASHLFHRQISGLSDELQGDIRIGVSELVGIFLLPAALVAFRELHPKVQIEVHISNDTASLSKRDADIALRMYRPTQPDLVVTRLPDIQLGFFASETYLKKHGIPTTLEDLFSHNLIGYDRNMDFINAANQLGFKVSPHHFSLRSDQLLEQIQFARAGGGIVVTHIELAKQWRELQQVLQTSALDPLESWIACHADTQHNLKIRELMKFLAQWFRNNPYQYISSL